MNMVYNENRHLINISGVGAVLLSEGILIRAWLSVLSLDTPVDRVHVLLDHHQGKL